MKQIGLEGSSGSYLTVTGDKPSVLTDITPHVRDCFAEKKEIGGTTLGYLRCNQKGVPDVTTMCVSGKDAETSAIKNTGILIFGNTLDFDPITSMVVVVTPVVVMITCAE